MHGSSTETRQRMILVAVVLLFVALQYRLWFADGSLPDVQAKQTEIERQEAVNAGLEARNAGLRREVDALRTDPGVIEAQARWDLGMVVKGETFYLMTEEPGE